MTTMTSALLYARAELERGAGELGVDNGGPDVATYHARPFVRGRSYGHWCAAFVSWCLVQAGLLPGVVRGAKRLCRDVAALGTWVYRPRALRAPLELAAPAAGDVIAWHRGLPGSWEGHVGFVDSYDLVTDTVTTIEGNAGQFPCKVMRKTYPHGTWRRRLYGVARVQP